jgi:autotransporter family porin
LKEDGFAESGAGVLDLIVDGRGTESLVSELGVRTGYAFKFTNGSLIPEISASLLYDFGIDDNVVTSSFAGSPGATFSIKGQEPAKYGAVLGVGLTFFHNNGFSASAKYGGEFRERHTAHSVIGSIAYAF